MVGIPFFIYNIFIYLRPNSEMMVISKELDRNKILK